MTSIKLIAIDLDGTLLNSDKQLTENNLKALNYANEKGVKIVICTGRPYLAAKEILDQVGINTDGDYIITFNGGQIQNAQSGKVISSDTISTAEMLQWYEEMNRLKLPLNVIDDTWVYEPQAYDPDAVSTYVSDVTSAPSKSKDFYSFEDNHQFIKLVVSINEETLHNRIVELDKDLLNSYSTYFSHPFLFEVVKKGVSKGQALSKLGAIFGISMAEMLTIGDQDNDASMIEMAGIGVAMGNATEAIKTMADYVTDTNNRDGVAKAIYHFIQ